MAIDHEGIIKHFGVLRAHATGIVARAKDASGDIGGIEDNKPSARAVAKLDSEILRLRALYLVEHVAFLAAIDS